MRLPDNKYISTATANTANTTVMKCKCDEERVNVTLSCVTTLMDYPLDLNQYIVCIKGLYKAFHSAANCVLCRASFEMSWNMLYLIE